MECLLEQCISTVDGRGRGLAARSQAQLRAVTIGRIIVAPQWTTTKKGQTFFGVIGRDGFERPSRPDEAGQGLRTFHVDRTVPKGWGQCAHCRAKLARNRCRYHIILMRVKLRKSELQRTAAASGQERRFCDVSTQRTRACEPHGGITRKPREVAG